MNSGPHFSGRRRPRHRLAPVLIGRMPPLGRHDRPTREQALAALGASRVPLLRQLFLTLKTVTSLAYGADPVVRRSVGYPRPAEGPRWVRHHELRRRGRTPTPLRNF
jgi:hypothetical protein